MKKRLAALILAAAMLISCLAACGGNDESASVSRQLSDQARTLNSLISRFHIA